MGEIIMQIIRRCLENIFRDKTRKRHLPDMVGGAPFYASSAGGLRQLFYPMNTVDPDLFLTAKRLVKTGDIVWDIGTNVGLFTFSSAGLAGPSGKIFSFEPDTHLVGLLRKSAALQNKTSSEVSIIPSGIAGETGVRTFHIAKRSRASNSLADYGNQQMGGTRQTQSIVCLSLDTALSLLPKPSVVKIDVEGAEVEILSATKALFADVRPRVAVEAASPSRDNITQIFKQNDYHMFDANGSFVQGAEIDRAVWNTIAIPSEQLHFIPSAS